MKKTDLKDYVRKIAFGGMVLFTILLASCAAVGKYGILSYASVVLYATCNLMYVLCSEAPNKLLAYLALEIIQPIPLLIILFVDAILK